MFGLAEVRRQKEETVPWCWEHENYFFSIIWIHQGVAAFVLRLQRPSNGFLVFEAGGIPPCQVGWLLVSVTALSTWSPSTCWCFFSWVPDLFLFGPCYYKSTFVKNVCQCLICSSVVQQELFLRGGPWDRGIWDTRGVHWQLWNTFLAPLWR